MDRETQLAIALGWMPELGTFSSPASEAVTDSRATRGSGLRARQPALGLTHAPGPRLGASLFVIGLLLGVLTGVVAARSEGSSDETQSSNGSGASCSGEATDRSDQSRKVGSTAPIGAGGDSMDVSGTQENPAYDKGRPRPGPIMVTIAQTTEGAGNRFAGLDATRAAVLHVSCRPNTVPLGVGDTPDGGEDAVSVSAAEARHNGCGDGERALELVAKARPGSVVAIEEPFVRAQSSVASRGAIPNRPLQLGA